MPAPLQITHAHLLDPTVGALSDASWMEIADGRITDTGSGPPPPAGPHTRVIDAAGATVMPGLIDAHVHVLVTTLDLADVNTWTPGYATVRALAEAERMLRRGFTTVRDGAMIRTCGSPWRGVPSRMMVCEVTGI